MNPKAVVTLFFVCAGLLVAGTLMAAMVAPQVLGAGSRGCTLPGAPGGAALAPAAQGVEVHRDGFDWQAVRTLSYAAPAAGLDAVLACVDTGKLDLVAGAEGAFAVEAVVVGYGNSEQSAREAAALDPVVRAGGGTLVAHDPPRARAPWSDTGTTMSFRITAPPSVALHATLASDTGSLRVDGVRLRGLFAAADTGRVTLDPSWAEGTLRATTDTGGIEARFPALGPSEVWLATDTGAVRAWVPADVRHGYYVWASTDTGSVALDLPGLRDRVAERDGASQHREALTDGFDAREVQVALHLTTDTGGIALAAT